MLLDQTVGDLLREAAQQTPTTVALQEVAPPAPDGAPGPSRSWTYAELLVEAEASARWLLTRFQPGETIFPVEIEDVLLRHPAGVDYSIFLVTRAREVARTQGTREGMLTTVRVTGGVITSAGILLASVFAVLGVLPLIVLTQIGIIVFVGVLLDTLVVRTGRVPAIAIALGDRFWWPSRLTEHAEPPAPAPHD